MRIQFISLLVGASLGASAATITWDAAQNITDNTDVLIPGDLHNGDPIKGVLAAYNIGPFPEEVSVNGVLFSVSSEHGVSGAPWDNFGDMPLLSKEYGETLLKQAMYNVNQIALSNLVAGTEYVVQIWTSDTNGTTRTTEFDDGTSTSNFTGSASQWGHPYGQHIVGRFEANSDTQVIQLSQTSSNDYHRVVNAYAIYGLGDFVPPPAKIAWETAENITGETDVLAIGDIYSNWSITDIHLAINAGDSDQLVNSLNFVADNSGITGDAPAVLAGGNNLPAGTYSNLMNMAARNTESFQITGLTLGKEYLIQVWSHDAANENTIFDDGNGNTVDLSQYGGPDGQFAIGKFTATGGNTETITLTTSAPSDEHRVLNAYVVYEVEKYEPPKSTIIWDTAVHISGDADVINTDSLHNGGEITSVHSAFNLGGTNGPVVVNGVTFTNAGHGAIGNAWQDFGDMPLLSSVYGGDLLKTGMWGTHSFTLSNLTVGAEYVVQAWVVDKNGTTRKTNFDDGTGAGNFTGSANQWGNPYGDFIVGRFTARSTIQPIVLSQTGAPNNNGRILNAYAVYTVQGVTTYAGWISGFGLSGSDGETDDPDSDGVNNLYEYAFDGHPNDDTNQGTLPMFSIKNQGGSNVLEYVHVERTDSGNELTYLLKVRNDLLTGSWLSTNYTATSGSLNSTLDSVTNMIPMDTPEMFIKLDVSR